MNAKEAAKHSDAIECNGVIFVQREEDIWLDRNGNVHRIDDLNSRGCFYPLVPKRLYPDGFKVSILSAIRSGQIFDWNGDYYRCSNDDILEVYHHGEWKTCRLLQTRTNQEVFIVGKLPEVWVDCSFEEMVQYLKGNPFKRTAKLEIKEHDHVYICLCILHNNELTIWDKDKIVGLLSDNYRFLDYYEGKWQIKKE